MKARATVLLVEDDPDIVAILRDRLARENYQLIVASDGEDGLARIRAEAPQLVILDLVLPGIEGIEVCRRLRADPLTSTIPVLMLTSKSEETDVVLGLGVGADDYVIKPFRPNELVARVKALLRRGPVNNEGGAGDRIVRHQLVIDTGRHEVLVDGESIVFTPTELRLLHLLAAHPGRVFTREQLVSRVIGEHAVVIDRNIDVHIRAIRKKLDEHRDLVETVRGVGYRFKP